MNKFKTGLAVMRAQPFHLGHEKIVRQMLAECDDVFILLGSVQESGTQRNPFTYAQRRQMIENVFGRHPRLHIKPIADLGNNDHWVNYVCATACVRPDVYYCGDDQDGAMFKAAGIDIIEFCRKGNPISATTIRESRDWSKLNPLNISLVRSVLDANKDTDMLQKSIKYNFGRPKCVPLATGRIAASTNHYDIWEYPVVQPNGNAAIYEMCVRQNAAMVIAEVDGKIVVTRQIQQKGASEKYCLLGGMIEEGEHPQHAAMRELAEESGLTSDDWQLLGQINHTNRMAWTDYLYMARNCKQTTTQHLDSGEQINLMHVTVEDFMSKILMSPDFRDTFVKDILIKTPSPQDIARMNQLARGR